MSVIKPDSTDSTETPSAPLSGPSEDDFSNVQFKRAGADRSRQGSKLWSVVLFTMLIIGLIAAKELLLSPSGDGGASSGLIASNSESSLGGGSLEPGRFISCWNENSSRINQLRPLGEGGGHFSSESRVGVIFSDGQVFISGSLAAPGTFVRQTVVAIQCSSGMSRGDAVEVYDSLHGRADQVKSRGGLPAADMNIGDKRYSLSFFMSDPSLMITPN